MSKKNIENKHTQKYLGNKILCKARASKQTCSFDVPYKINGKRENIIHSNVSEEKIPQWVIEKNKTLSFFTIFLPPPTLEVFYEKRDWWGNFILPKLFTDGTGYQEVRIRILIKCHYGRVRLHLTFPDIVHFLKWQSLKQDMDKLKHIPG